MTATLTRNVINTEFTVDQLRDGWLTGKKKMYQTFPEKVDEKGVVHVRLLDNSDIRGEGDMPAQYIVTRETCTCGRVFCPHRAYVVAVNDKIGVPVGRYKTMGGYGVGIKK